MLYNRIFQSYNHFLILQNFLPLQSHRFGVRLFCCEWLSKATLFSIHNHHNYSSLLAQRGNLTNPVIFISIAFIGYQLHKTHSLSEQPFFFAQSRHSELEEKHGLKSITLTVHFPVPAQLPQNLISISPTKESLLQPLLNRVLMKNTIMIYLLVFILGIFQDSLYDLFHYFFVIYKKHIPCLDSHLFQPNLYILPVF